MAAAREDTRRIRRVRIQEMPPSARRMRPETTRPLPFSARLQSLIRPGQPAQLATSEARVDRVSQTRHHRSEEHTSELQSRQYLVCRLLLEKKNDKKTNT